MPSNHQPDKYEHVKTSEESWALDDRKPQRRNLFLKLGTHAISMLLISFLGIFLVIVLLVILWHGSLVADSLGGPTQLWHEIYKRDWMTPVVTVSSVITRAATTAQMGVFASAVAAIMLEKNSVILRRLPLLSVIRTINNGPTSHITNIMDTFRLGTVAGYVYSTTLLLAILVLLALQFTSTILLSDFGLGVVMIEQRGVVPYDDRGVLPYWITDPWQVSIIRLPRFAEHYNRPREPKPDDSFVDTGLAYRAFLPLADETERQGLRNYLGPAKIFNAQTICVQPNLDLININETNGE
jgi:hypothetical protein